jgi:protein ImuB
MAKHADPADPANPDQSNPPQWLPQILPHHPGEDLEILQQLAETFHHRVTPLVAIETIDKKPWVGYPRHQSESLICDISGVSHLYGGEVGLLTSVTQMLASLGLAARMAIADHQATAWAVAHGMTPEMSSELADSQDRLPPRCTIVPTGSAEQCQTKTFIEPLCVTTLRIDQPTARALDRLGIQTIGQLLKLPRSGLAARLGTPLVRRIAEVLGESDPPLVIHRVPVEHCETWTLEYPTDSQVILQDRIARLMKRIRAGLATRKRGALRMTCRLDLSAHPPLTLEVGLFAPTTDVDHLCELFSSRLESVRLPADVNRLTLSVNLSGPIRSTQISLLGDSSGNGSFGNSIAVSQEMAGSSIGHLVDSFSNRLGRDRVVKIHLQKDPLPEAAYRTSPLVGNPVPIRRRRTEQRSRHSEKPTHHPQPSDAMRRPLSLLASPLPLAVAFEGGSFCKVVSSTDLPDRLRLHNVAYRLQRWWGPERIETGWWSGPSVRRDYFRVEINEQQWWWIYRDCSLCDHQHCDHQHCDHQHCENQSPRYRWLLHGRFA